MRWQSSAAKGSAIPLDDIRERERIDTNAATGNGRPNLRTSLGVYGARASDGAVVGRRRMRAMAVFEQMKKMLMDEPGRPSQAQSPPNSR